MCTRRRMYAYFKSYHRRKNVLDDPTQGWLYLVLDEAHLLRNPATRTAKAARELRASHRLGLTGTPIQNSVLELWSLFEFLMPG